MFTRLTASLFVQGLTEFGSVRSLRASYAHRKENIAVIPGEQMVAGIPVTGALGVFVDPFAR